MHIPADVPIVALVASAAVLLASTALLSHTLPIIRRPRWSRRRPRRRSADRLVITGRPPALPPGPIPAVTTHLAIAPPRQQAAGVDVSDRTARLAEAEATIEQLIETDPDYLARMMMLWIRDDDEQESRR